MNTFFTRGFPSEKCPTITVASFFFFRQTTELTLYVALFVHYAFLPEVLSI